MIYVMSGNAEMIRGVSSCSPSASTRVYNVSTWDILDSADVHDRDVTLRDATGRYCLLKLSHVEGADVSVQCRRYGHGAIVTVVYNGRYTAPHEGTTWCEDDVNVPAAAY